MKIVEVRIDFNTFCTIINCFVVDVYVAITIYDSLCYRMSRLVSAYITFYLVFDNWTVALSEMSIVAMVTTCHVCVKCPLVGSFVNCFFFFNYIHIIHV